MNLKFFPISAPKMESTMFPSKYAAFLMRKRSASSARVYQGLKVIVI